MSTLRLTSTLLTVLLMAASCSVPLAQAGLVVSNLDEESMSGWGTSGSAYGPENWVANRFVVGAGIWSLGSIELPLHTYNWPNTFNYFTLEIRDGGAMPGNTILGTFDTTSPIVDSSYAQRFTYEPAAPLSLAGGNYWLVLRPSHPESSDFMQLALSGNETAAVGGWSIDDVGYYSSNGNSGWQPVADNLPLTFAFDATQTAVPEPSSFALAAGLVGGAWWKRRRTRRGSEKEPLP